MRYDSTNTKRRNDTEELTMVTSTYTRRIGFGPFSFWIKFSRTRAI